MHVNNSNNNTHCWYENHYQQGHINRWIYVLLPGLRKASCTAESKRVPSMRHMRRPPVYPACNRWLLPRWQDDGRTHTCDCSIVRNILCVSSRMSIYNFTSPLYRSGTTSYILKWDNRLSIFVQGKLMRRLGRKKIYVTVKEHSI
jgi:hypothetical protein